MLPNFDRYRNNNMSTIDVEAEYRKRRCFVRIGALLFVAIVIFFGARGTLNINSDNNIGRCPSRRWMPQPDFICQRVRPEPIPETDSSPLFKTIHLDCNLAPLNDITILFNLCCVFTHVVFERISVSTLEFEDGSIMQLPANNMQTALTIAANLLCKEFPIACNTTCT